MVSQPFTLTLPQIAELTKIVGSSDRPHMSVVAIAYGTNKNTLIGFCWRRGITIAPIIAARKPATPPAMRSPRVRYTSLKARKPTDAQRLQGTLSKPKKLKPLDRQEIDRLIAEAVAAGKVTRLPPGIAKGSNLNTWFEKLGQAS